MENQEVLKGHGTFDQFVEDTARIMRKNRSPIAIGWFGKRIFLVAEDEDESVKWIALRPYQARELARALEAAARETFDA